MAPSSSSHSPRELRRPPITQPGLAFPFSCEVTQNPELSENWKYKCPYAAILAIEQAADDKGKAKGKGNWAKDRDNPLGLPPCNTSRPPISIYRHGSRLCFLHDLAPREA
ncbi:hypothetical protein FDECE_5883 [Fusarium decemcellulare]|nr:hypothetical protein FDECE_5883 [Fusarium decemcellulare]